MFGLWLEPMFLLPDQGYLSLRVTEGTVEVVPTDGFADLTGEEDWKVASGVCREAGAEEETEECRLFRPRLA